MRTLIQTPDFQRIFESSPGCYLVLAPDLTILAASDAYLRATMTRREEIVGRGFFEVFPDDPDDPEATGECNLRTSVERVIRDKSPDSMGVQKHDIRSPRSKCGGFEVRYWSPVNFPVMNDGEVDCIIQYVQDVTEYVRLKKLDVERLQAGGQIWHQADQIEVEMFNRAVEIQEVNAKLERTIEQLRQSEEMCRLFMQGVTEYAIFFLDIEGCIKTWTAAAQRITGYTADEIVGKHFSILFPREDIENGKPQRELRIAIETGQYEEEGWRIRKDGSQLWANILITALYDSDGRHVGYSKIARDLTERKIADEKLRSNEAKFRGLLESAPDAMVIVDEGGGIQLSNAQATRLFGYTPEELQGQPVELLIPEEHRASHVAKRDAYLRSPVVRGMGIGLDLCGRRKDGSLFPVEISLSPLDGSNGPLVCAAIRDATERKQAQRVLEGTNQALRARTLQLEATNRELEAFSYSLSHDLRAPLRAIDGFSLAVMEDCAGKLDSENVENLQRVRAAAQRMAQLIDAMLNLSRLTRTEMRREEVDLSKVAREIAGELHGNDPARNVEFVIADGLMAQADPRLIRVAITNLLQNAWKFTRQRSIGRIEFGQSLDDGVKAFFVRDNGAGFDMAYAAKLFGAFQRLHAATEYPGTGIGLATVQRVISRHGGRVWAQAAVDQGATFYFTL